MKSIVKPTAEHMYMDAHNGQVIEAFRPSVISTTNYTNTLLASGKIKLLASNLTDDATDEEFAKFVTESKGDHDLAVSSFESKFSAVKPAEEPAPAKPTAAKAK